MNCDRPAQTDILSTIVCLCLVPSPASSSSEPYCHQADVLPCEERPPMMQGEAGNDVTVRADHPITKWIKDQARSLSSSGKDCLQVILPGDHLLSMYRRSRSATPSTQSVPLSPCHGQHLTALVLLAAYAKSANKSLSERLLLA